MKIKIIDQAEEMSIDLFEAIVNEFLSGDIRVVNIRVNTIKTGLLRSTIIYDVRRTINKCDSIGNRL